MFHRKISLVGGLASALFIVLGSGCATAQDAAAQAPATPATKTPGTARPLRKEAGHKKLLTYVSREAPDTAFMRKHIAQMEKSPFDGVFFTIKVTKPDGTQGNFMSENWGSHAFTEADFKPALDDIKATKFGRFTDNFPLFLTVSTNRDWFDDFSAIMTNARLTASFARQANKATGGRVPGILFDPEQYVDKLFTYSAQRDKATKSWDVYAAQARKRGRELMEAFQEGYPDLTVFSASGYSGAFYYVQRGEKLSEQDYGLLAPFMDGMTEAAKGKTKIVDGYEIGYPLKANQWRLAYKAMDEDLLGIVADPKKYRQNTSAGFGTWLDFNYTTWNVEDVSKNHFTPEEYEGVVRRALELSDEYVWMFTDQVRWWSEEGKPVKLPPAYDAAIRRARQGQTPD